MNNNKTFGIVFSLAVVFVGAVLAQSESKLERNLAIIVVVIASVKLGMFATIGKKSK
jgi:hypothetical protein